MISCNPPREESASDFTLQHPRSILMPGAADQILQRPVDEQHDRAHVDAANGRGDCGADGRCVLDITGQQHFDIERCRHDHDLRAQTLLLKKSMVFGDEERHRSNRDRRQADLDVLGLSRR